MRLSLTLSLFLIMLADCKSPGKSNNVSPVPKNPTVAKTPVVESLPFLDTVIRLRLLKDKHNFNIAITNTKARIALYKYFKAKGVLPRQDVKISPDSVNKLCVNYDTIYHIKGDGFGGAVVSYWIGPADLNGHCFQPSKAFIQVISNGYVISNENFISSNFAIDSTTGSNIYGYDYDCGGKGVVRRFKIILK